MIATRWGELWAGARATAPLVVGAIPFGILFGALAVSTGLTTAAAMGMSALVYAGSAQFIAAGLVASGGGVGVIVLTTLVVNLRHALYAASLAPFMRHLPQVWLATIAFWLTDETYAVAINRYQRSDDSPFKQWFYVGSALFMYVNWQICTLIGVRAGRAVADPQAWGLDFAFVATFIGIVAPTIRRWPAVACVAAAGVSALVLRGLPHQLGLVGAAVIGVVAGVIVSSLARREKGHE